MFLPLDGLGPIHAQLTRALRSALVDGRYPDGFQLPSSRTLARELGLSRNTVLAAYEELRGEGFVAAKVGSGSYVTSRARAQPVLEHFAQNTPAQSRYATRARIIHDHAAMPGRRNVSAKYAFQYGVPLVNPALTTAWSRELARAALYTTPSYAPSQGVYALREAVCEYLSRRRGVQTTPDSILIVAGTQQAISLCCRVLLDEADRVAIEDPQYFAMREVLQIHGAVLQPVPVDRDGLQTNLLPAHPPKLICVTPSHQFPTGSVLSLERRIELLAYAERHQCWILEDDYDGEFRYDNKPLAALRYLDTNDRVIYVGTFSKVLFPSLRLGYLVMPKGLQQDFVNAKWADDFGQSGVEQNALANFIKGGSFERHLRRSAKTLKLRRDCLITGLRGMAPQQLEIADSNAGMHVVVWLTGKTVEEGEAFVAHASSIGLGLHSIKSSYLGRAQQAALLMGFADLSVGEIRQALELFKTCLDQTA